MVRSPAISSIIDFGARRQRPRSGRRRRFGSRLRETPTDIPQSSKAPSSLRSDGALHALPLQGHGGDIAVRGAKVIDLGARWQRPRSGRRRRFGSRLKETLTDIPQSSKAPSSLRSDGALHALPLQGHGPDIAVRGSKVIDFGARWQRPRSGRRRRFGSRLRDTSTDIPHSSKAQSPLRSDGALHINSWLDNRLRGYDTEMGIRECCGAGFQPAPPALLVVQAKMPAPQPQGDGHDIGCNRVRVGPSKPNARRDAWRSKDWSR